MKLQLSIALFAALGLTGSSDASAQDPAPSAEPAPPLTRVALIGASVSAGAGNAAELELGKDARLGAFLDAMLADEHAASEIHDFGDMWFFSNPRKKGRMQLEKALETKPTAIVACDFLFWFAFGQDEEGDRRRAPGLAEGLELLESIEVPLLIGDLPNIEHALAGKGPLGGPLVSRDMFPSEAERLAMNATIRSWAKARPSVEVLALDSIMTAMREGQEMEVHGNRWKPASLEEVLQRDLLHPNVRGSAWVAMYVASALTDFSDIELTDFLWDEAQILANLRDATAEARAEQAERVKRRKERRRKAEERKREKTGSRGGD